MGEINLDTNILIDLIERKPIDKIIALASKYDLKISIIVYFEFMVGAYKIKKSQLKNIILKYIEPIPITIEIADLAAKVEAKLIDEGMMLDPRDILIASTAIIRNARLWTKNKSHFERLKSFGLKFFENQI